VCDSQVVGRYAPSPTGDLHLGNIRTALIAWLHARVQGGRFLLRIEDLDLPRVVKGSAEKIIHDLEWLGLDWDGEVVVQSKRNDLYEAALSKLEAKDLVYPCFCSRKDIRQAASAPHAEVDGVSAVYAGTCAHLSNVEIATKKKLKEPALRLRVSGSLVDSCGDFVIKRADTLFAYQLAVVVDDLDQGVTEVVRGTDLLESTDRQLYLAKKLQPKVSPINYLHAPLMLDTQGKRMSKRDGSLSITEYRAKGYSAHKLIGELAAGLGLIDQNRALSASELLMEIRLSALAAVMNALY